MRRGFAQFVLVMSGIPLSAANHTETWVAWGIGNAGFWALWLIGSWLIDREIDAAREGRDG